MNRHLPAVLLLDLGDLLRGGQRQVLYLAKYLLEQKDIVPLIACSSRSALAHAAMEDGLPLLPLASKYPWNPWLWKTLLTELRENNSVRIIHTQDARSALVGAALKRFFPKIKLVHSRRVSYRISPGIHAWKYKQADAVVGVSQEIVRQMRACGVSPEKTFAIHSGIDPEVYALRARKEPATPFIFLAIGALTPQKGFSTLLDAAALLARDSSLPSWQVTLVGDGPLRKSLHAQADRLGLFASDTRRLSMPGSCESRKVLPFADAVLVPSSSGEGSSATIKEAWASKLPVIASNLSSNCELVTHTVNGLLFDVNNPVSLAGEMKKCLTDATLYTRLVEGGSKTLPQFTHIRMAASYRHLYNTLLRGEL